VNNSPPTDASVPAESVDFEHVERRVLVVGAGAAGARTAIELVDRGVDPDDVQDALDADYKLDYHQLE